MAQKRSRKSTSAANQSLDLESTESTQDSLGISYYNGINGRSAWLQFRLCNPPFLMTLPKIAETRTSTTLITTSSFANITVTTTSTTTSRQIVSDASIADPEHISARRTSVFANNEKASDLFANFLMDHVLSPIPPMGLYWIGFRDCVVIT